MAHLQRASNVAALPHDLLTAAARTTIDEARKRIEQGALLERSEILEQAEITANAVAGRLLQPMINATGILLHTNLGRAPLGTSTIDAIIHASGSTNLEYIIETGQRGSRHDHAGHLLALACGAEAGMIVNNNAAAVVLVLATLARGKEVVVSRGELVEIGGGFRVPEILAETSAQLIEVGTTNRTRLRDYEKVINDNTAMTLKVHASNYRMVGFTEATSVAELATLSVPVVVDAGSGLLDRDTPWLAQPPSWLADEPGIRQTLDDGASIVTFSGDKLLGGPQSGIIVGTRVLIERCKQHPLARALRCDKTTIAGLQAVAIAYLDRDASQIPLWQRATAEMSELRARGNAIINTTLSLDRVAVVDHEAAAGGGSLPGHTIPSLALAVVVSDVTSALRHLRTRHHIVAIARDGRVLCDLRSVGPGEDALIGAALADLIATFAP